MSETNKSVVKSISVLGIAGILCKVIGVLFSVPLNMISPRIATDFYLVYPTYTLLLTISSAGLPVAVSRMVAGFIAQKDRRSAKSTFRIALITLFLLGFFFSILMILINGTLVNNAVDSAELKKEVSGGYYAIAPCVLIVCVLSAFRGLFQGQQNMVPTAVSQLIEQIGKVIISLPLAYFGLKRSPVYGAVGALLGITLAETAALIYMVLRYYLKRKELNAIPQDPDCPPVQVSFLLKRMINISVPITISACIIPFSSFIDSQMMIKRMVISGLSNDIAYSYYGLFTSVVIRLINIPTALALAISMSLVPAVSAHRAVNDRDGICRETNIGIRYAFLIGFPCSVGMSILSRQIVTFFYGRVFSSEMLQLAADLLTFSAMTVVLFTVVQSTSSILQGLRKQRIPMYTMIAGVAVKIILNYVLIATPGINIHGGPYASIACYFIVMILNLICVCRCTEMKFNFAEWVLRPGIAALVMGIVVWVLQHFLPVHPLITVLEILIGITVFVAAAFACKALTKDDVRSLMHRRRK